MTALFLASMAAAAAQEGTVQIQVHHDSRPVPCASVIVNGAAHETDPAGVATVAVPPGAVHIVVSSEGFAPASLSLTLAAGQQQIVVVDLQRASVFEEEVIVAATRTGKRLEDQPTRVEVVPREEMQAKS